MGEKEIISWKKVFESDLTYIAYELKEYAKIPSVIILDGPMGSGKTTFAKVFIGEGQTFSPSYSIVSECNNCLHADLDRIEDRQELIHLELGLHLDNKTYFLVEWGKKHLSALHREVPDNFSFYMLSIQMQSASSNDQEDFRNFTLYELSDV